MLTVFTVKPVQAVEDVHCTIQAPCAGQLITVLAHVVHLYSVATEVDGGTYVRPQPRTEAFCAVQVELHTFGLVSSTQYMPEPKPVHSVVQLRL